MQAAGGAAAAAAAAPVRCALRAAMALQDRCCCRERCCWARRMSRHCRCCRCCCCCRLPQLRLGLAAHRYCYCCRRCGDCCCWAAQQGCCWSDCCSGTACRLHMQQNRHIARHSARQQLSPKDSATPAPAPCSSCTATTHRSCRQEQGQEWRRQVGQCSACKHTALVRAAACQPPLGPSAAVGSPASAVDCVTILQPTLTCCRTPAGRASGRQQVQGWRSAAPRRRPRLWPGAAARRRQPAGGGRGVAAGCSYLDCA